MSNNRITENLIKEKLKNVEYNVYALEGGPRMTICFITLDNGFIVHGMSACVDPANYDEFLGESIAYKEAFEKIWQLEGYLLREKLYGDSKS
jgi:uncharacterized protein YodC (DUF2158 family)